MAGKERTRGRVDDAARSGRGGRRGESASSTFKPQGKREAHAKPAGNDRIARVAARIRADLADVFMRGSVRDPDAIGAIVSAVTVTNDLSLARVFMRLLDSAPTEARKKALLKALDRANGHIRSELAQRLDLRSVPELRFAWDATSEEKAKMDALFDEVEADRQRFGAVSEAAEPATEEVE